MSTDRVTLSKPQFAQVPAWVARHPDLLSNQTALAAYVHLSLMADYKTRLTTSDWRELVEVTGWSRPTVMRAMKSLRDAGVIERVGDVLRLPMDEPVGLIFDTESPGESQKRDSAVSNMRLAPISTEIIPERVKGLAALPPPGNGELFHVEPSEKPTDDPVKATAHRLATLAFSQTPKPVSPFPAVLARIEAELRAEQPCEAIEAAILAGDVTWTANGLRTAISKARPKRDPLRRGGPSLADQVERARRLENEKKAAGR
jgi:hypothetical protein